MYLKVKSCHVVYMLCAKYGFGPSADFIVQTADLYKISGQSRLQYASMHSTTYVQYASKKVANTVYRLTIPFKQRFVKNRMVTSKTER